MLEISVKVIYQRLKWKTKVLALLKTKKTEKIIEYFMQYSYYLI